MRAAGVHVPQIFVSDLEQGFLLLSDLGAEAYLASLTDSNADQLFSDAIDTMIRWQLSTTDGVLPPYDDALLRRELNLFPDWFVARHLERPLTDAQNAALARMFSRIVAANLAQARVFVHREHGP